MACSASESRMVTISAWTGEYKNVEALLYIEADDWARGHTERGISLKKLTEEGWRIISVIKTNQGAQSFQLLFFMEIPADKYPSTFFAKLKKKPMKKGSEGDL